MSATSNQAMTLMNLPSMLEPVGVYRPSCLPNLLTDIIAIADFNILNPASDYLRTALDSSGPTPVSSTND
jgi:hypothetical protein